VEHLRPDLLRRFAAALFQAAEEAGFRLAIEVVEDLRDQLVGVAARRAREVGHELGAQDALHPVEDVFLDRFHPQHAHDDLHGEGVRQRISTRAEWSGLIIDSTTATVWGYSFFR
jgi:hypothetical protein